VTCISSKSKLFFAGSFVAHFNMLALHTHKIISSMCHIRFPLLRPWQGIFIIRWHCDIWKHPSSYSGASLALLSIQKAGRKPLVGGSTIIVIVFGHPQLPFLYQSKVRLMNGITLDFRMCRHTSKLYPHCNKQQMNWPNYNDYSFFFTHASCILTLSKFYILTIWSTSELS